VRLFFQKMETSELSTREVFPYYWVKEEKRIKQWWYVKKKETEHPSQNQVFRSLYLCNRIF